MFVLTVGQITRCDVKEGAGEPTKNQQPNSTFAALCVF